MSRWTEVEPVIADLDHGLWGMDWDKALAEAIIRDAPSIDIVRCGECKYCSKDRIKWSVKDEDGNWIDTKCNLCRHTKLEVNLDDFCSYGEREGK